MWSVVEEQHMPVGKQVRRMLPGERRSTKLPVDFPRLSVDHYDSGDVAEAHQNVSIGHLRNSVAERPGITVVLNRRDAVLDGIEMLPSAPLPHDLSFNRHFDEVIADH